MGQWFPPLYGKSKFFHRKKEKALKKIAKLQNVVQECERAISEETSKSSTKN